MSSESLEDLRARATLARERYDLYKAKAYGMRPTSEARMRELARESEQAEARLRAALAEEGEGPGSPASSANPGAPGENPGR